MPIRPVIPTTFAAPLLDSVVVVGPWTKQLARSEVSTASMHDFPSETPPLLRQLDIGRLEDPNGTHTNIWVCRQVAHLELSDVILTKVYPVPSAWKHAFVSAPQYVSSSWDGEAGLANKLASAVHESCIG